MKISEEISNISARISGIWSPLATSITQYARTIPNAFTGVWGKCDGLCLYIVWVCLTANRLVPLGQSCLCALYGEYPKEPSLSFFIYNFHKRPSVDASKLQVLKMKL